MKKRIVIAVTVLALVFMIAGCTVRPVGGGTSGKNRLDDLNGCRISLAGAQSVGILQKDMREASGAKASGSAKKNFLVTFDDSGNIHDVVFMKTVLGTDTEIKQEQIAAQVDKVYVAKRFTYVRFTTKQDIEDGRKNDRDFDTKDYLCNDTYQSFVIDNLSGKVYSLAGQNVVTRVGACYIICGNKYYKPEIKNNDLVLTPYVTNPKITVNGVTEDKFGTVFVENDTTAETVGNTVYYKNSRYLFDGPQYRLGDDGMMYVVTEDSLDYSVQRYTQAKQLETIGNNVTVTLLNDTNSYHFLVRNELLYRYNENIMSTFYRTGETFYYASCHTTDVRDFAAAGGVLFGINKNDALAAYKAVKTGESSYYPYTMQETLTGITATTIASMGSYLLATVEKVSGTQRYKVYMNGDTPVIELLDSLTYSDNLITVQPLN